MVTRSYCLLVTAVIDHIVFFIISYIYHYNKLKESNTIQF